MSLESPRTPPAEPAEAPVSANQTVATDRGHDSTAALPEARALGSPPPATNGEPAPRNRSGGPGSSSRLPRPRQWSRRRKILTFGLLGLLAVGLVGALFLGWTGALFGRPPYNGPTWTVKLDKIKLTIVARGSLESAKNGDIICKVKSGTKGGTNATIIKWLIDNGTEVKKDDTVIILDDSGLQETLKAQNILVDNAKADWVKATEQYRIDEIQCQSDLEKKVNARDLAKIDLQKYIEGDFIFALKDVEGRSETAKSDLEDWKDRAAWSARMTKKGLMSKVQSDADASKRDAARIALEKVQEERRVLVEYTKRRTIQDLTAKVAEAVRDLEKQKIQNKAVMAQDEALRQSKKSVYEQEFAKKKEYEGEIEKCVVKAPQDGLVVYYIPPQVRGGGGSQQSVVAQGEPVREGQKMMLIPDLTHMLVNVRVPEAFVAHLHNEEDPDDRSTWQHAQIRADAFSNRILPGHVKMIDTVASQQDYFASDVKVYKTLVSIDQSVEGLKPDMSAEVTIFADESPTKVLVVPVQAVIGTISMGAQRKCFVIGADGQPEMRDIVVGMSNERIVEVKSGLKEGERVVQDPQPLLGDSEMKAGKSGSKKDEGHDGGADDGKKSGKKGKKKAGGPGPGPDGFKGPPGPPTPGGPAGKAFSGSPPSAEMIQAWREKMNSATPAQRRDMINAIPDPAMRERARQKLRDEGREVAD